MPLMIRRSDLETTIRLLHLVVMNAGELGDIADAQRLIDLFHGQLPSDNGPIALTDPK